MKEYKEVNRLIKYGLPLLVVVLWLLSFWVIPLIKGQPQSVGEFGDMFGSLDTLFSGLAFAGLIIAIAYQRIELQIQREELKLQRKELSISNTELQKQREQLESQSNTFKKQNFESSFFRILELHNSILQEIIFNKCRGREAITRLNEDITAGYNRSNKYLQELTNIRTDFIDKHKKDPDDKESKSIDLQALQETFSYLFEDHLNVVGHYYRNLFHLFKYVDRSKDLIDMIILKS